jgi:N-methylhydantoinase B
MWSDSTGHPIGYGAHDGADGPHSLMHLGEAASRFASAEVWEARYPVVWERCELAPDSCGAGRWRGGLGVDASVRALADAFVTSVVERAKTPPWGLRGGLDARPNSARVRLPDGSERRCDKGTGVPVPRAAAYEMRTGGGGGHGSPSGRPAEAVREDLLDGYITPEHARLHYPHAFG